MPLASCEQPPVRSLTDNRVGLHIPESDKPLKVMYIISDLSVGGAEMALYRLLAAIDRREFEPIVVSLMDQGSLRQRLEKLGIEVHTTGMKSGRPSIFGLTRLISVINRVEPDLLVGWMHHSCLAAEIASLFTRKRVRTVWSLHYAITPGSPVKKLTAAVTRICRKLSKRPSMMIFVSEAGQRAHEQLGYLIDWSCVIPNGIDVEIFKPSTQARVQVRKELQLKEEAVLIGLIGRYHPMKDHANFLQAAALIAERNTEVHFVLVGRGVDHTNPELQELIVRLNLCGRVHLLGERADTEIPCAALDIFSLSSYDESCPNVVGEAMACGVPCVVTDVGDARQIVGDTGRVVAARDSKALATALLEMLALDSQSRRELGLAARNRVVEQFPIQRIAAQYGSVYRGIAVRHSKQSAARGEVMPGSTQNLEGQLG